MNIDRAIQISSYLISLAVILQGLEILAIRKTWSANGIWRLDILQQEIPQGFKTLFHEKIFLRLILFQILFALANMYFLNPVSLFALFSVTLLTSLRWRGTFNGGSDAMTTHILGALFLAVAVKDLALACLWYIAVQFVFSYFVAGFAKFKQRAWRSGTALQFFVQESNYAVPEKIKRLLGSPKLTLLSSWILILFELSFPLSLANKNYALIFISLSFLFHLVNFVVFGLNRFVFAWAAAYPVIYFLASN